MDSLQAVWPDWELKDLIGIGGWGRVYRAERRDGSGIQSAVKIIRTSAEKEKDVLDEIRRMKRLEGLSHIVSVEDYAVFRESEGSSVVLIRMELLTPLRSYLSDRTMAELDVLQMGADLCEGLSLCHRNGILHGDIKPDNILVNDSLPAHPLFKLGDFGIARVLGAPEPETDEAGEELTTACGTPEYLAPEQMEGRQDERSDLYALGITLYRYLNRDRLPFLSPYLRIPSHEDRTLALKIRLSGTPLPPAADASAETMALLRKACAWRPEDRFESVKAFQTALAERLRAKSEDTGPAEMLPAGEAPAGSAEKESPGKAPMQSAVKESAAEMPAGKAEERTPDAGMRKTRKRAHAESGGFRWGKWVFGGILLLAAAAALRLTFRIGAQNEPSPAATAVPLRQVEIREGAPLQTELTALADAWQSWISNCELPEELSIFPLMTDAERFLPDYQLEKTESDILLRIAVQPQAWDVLLCADASRSSGFTWSASEACWVHAAIPDGESAVLQISRNTDRASVEYEIDCATGKPAHITFQIRPNGRIVSLELIRPFLTETRESEPWTLNMMPANHASLKGLYDSSGRLIH